MKTRTNKSFAIVLFLAPVFALAQSGCSTAHSGKALDLSFQASGEALSAVGDSAEASAEVASGVVAVPVWISGAVVTGAGEFSGAVGEAATQSADALWDFASGDPEKRPALDKNAGLPPKKQTAATRDVSPAEAMKAQKL